MKTDLRAVKILRDLVKDYHYSDELIAHKLQRKSITVYRWRTGKSHPSFAEVRMLADILRDKKKGGRRCVK